MPDLPVDQSCTPCILWKDKKRSKQAVGLDFDHTLPRSQTDSTLVVLSKVQARNLLLVREIQGKAAKWEDTILIPQQEPTNLFRRVPWTVFIDIYMRLHVPWKPSSSPERRLRLRPNRCCIPSSKLSPSFVEWPDHATISISIFCDILRPWSHLAGSKQIMKCCPACSMASLTTQASAL